MLFRWATQQREAVHHKEMPGVDHMGILRQLQPAKEIADIIENLNNQLYEDVKYLNVEDYPKVEVLVWHVKCMKYILWKEVILIIYVE